MAQPIDVARLAFQYPQEIHVRCHGPLGYLNYQSYKPWLRDEFQFRCVYCLWRERWLSVGEDAFSVEHLQARAEAPERICDYENLVYASCRCNAVKTDARCVLDPCQQAYGHHLEIHPDGTIQGLTAQGRELIEICQLARPRITQARRQLFDLFRMLQESPDSRAVSLLQHYFGFPDNLPTLSQYRPPDGNSRPTGIAQSCHERRRRGELPAVY
jgi:hypothetical protein